MKLVNITVRDAIIISPILSPPEAQIQKDQIFLATIFGCLHFWVPTLSLIFRSAGHPQSAAEVNGTGMNSPPLKNRHIVCQDGHPKIKDLRISGHLRKSGPKPCPGFQKK